MINALFEVAETISDSFDGSVIEFFGQEKTEKAQFVFKLAESGFKITVTAEK